MAGLREVLGYWLKDRGQGESLDEVMGELSSELEHLGKRHQGLDVAKVESILNAAVHVEWNRKLNTEKFREDVRSVRERARTLARLIKSIYVEVDFPDEWEDGALGIAMRQVLTEIDADPYFSLGPVANGRRGHPGAESRRRALMRLRAAGLTKGEAESLLRIVRVRSYTR